MTEDEQAGTGLPRPFDRWPPLYLAVLLHLVGWMVYFAWLTP